jgi:hypothetical protein
MSKSKLSKDKMSKDIGTLGEPLWLSGKVEKNEKINEIKRPRVRSPPQATSFFKKNTTPTPRVA